MKLRLITVLFAFVISIVSTVALHAATITVTNTKDALAGSLRQAILDANPYDTIVFKIPTSDPGYYAPTGIYTVNLTSGGLSINKVLTISGVGSRIVVRRNVSASFPIFTVTSGQIAGIDSLTISNGLAPNGGGIMNLGFLFLDNSTLAGNQATSSGGALYSDNAVDGATISNCTFTANVAPVGAAITNIGELTLNDSTLSGNVASISNGGIKSISPAVTHVRNTIIAGNTGGSGDLNPDVYGTFDSMGYNFIGIGGTAIGFGESGSRDQVGTLANPADPKLGPLLNHGGYTATMAPLLGSLVIDQGKSDQPLLDFDQRGFSRPANQTGVVDAVDGDGSDIGAVELSEYQPGPDFTVNTTEDHDNGVCQIIGCSLREALNAANTSADANTIHFVPELAGMTIENTLTSTGLVITQPVTVNGLGARLLTISGGDSKRCLQVTGGTVVINGLTFAHGSNSVDLLPGGGILNSNGAILTLNDCSFLENNAESSSGIVDFGYGGGVGQYLTGQLNINRCSFADNTAGTGGGGLGNLGGTVVVTNSTFTRNSALNGGAISSSSSLDLRSSTVVGNVATSGAGTGGGVTQTAGTVTVTNSIIAGNTSEGSAPNVSGTFVSQGSNVIGGAAGSTGFTNGANGDQVGVLAPKVGTFANHGGLTDTMALLTGSAAINHANAATVPERDQRGYIRSDAADVGTFEFGGTIPVTLANISTRLNVDTGDNVLIVGFIITGTEDKKVLIRGIGPALPLAGKLANPILELHDDKGLIVSNDSWKSTQQAAIAATHIAPSSDLESAIVVTLPANSSSYTAIMRGVNNTTGIGLVEVYDLDRTVDSKLANISTRGLVQTGDNVMIAGLIVQGADPQDVIIRAIGPSLPLTGILANPKLELYDGDGTLLVSNDNWKSDQEMDIMATGLAPSKDLESAIVRTLLPASYTAILRGAGNTTGIALVDVYSLN